MNTYVGLSLTKLLAFRIRTHASTTKYLLKIILSRDARRELSKTAALRNTKSDLRAFVFGNGPSLSLLDPIKVEIYLSQGFHLITCNNFLYSDFARRLRPNFHVYSDATEFIEIPEGHRNYARGKAGKKDKQKVIDAGIPIFAPIHFRKYDDYEKMFYFVDVENMFGRNAGDITKPRAYLSVTGMKALAIACYLGYQNIYICGMDYDSFRSIKVDANNELYREVTHYHDDEKRPPYRLGGTRSMGEELYFEHVNFIVHEHFRKYPIVNLNTEGLLDMFPKSHELDIYR